MNLQIVNSTYRTRDMYHIITSVFCIDKNCFLRPGHICIKILLLVICSLKQDYIPGYITGT